MPERRRIAGVQAGESRGRRRESPDRLLVLYDAGCGICATSARFLRRLDRVGALDLVAAQVADDIDGVPPLDVRLAALQVRDLDGRWLRAGAAAVRVGEAVPPLRPVAMLARVPILRSLVEPVYAVVAANRHRISGWIGATACPVPPARP